MSSEQVVDISIDPIVSRRRRQRGWLRLGVPMLGVVFMTAAILFIALYSERANRAGVLALSDEVLSNLDGRIALQVAGYLDPAGRAVSMLRGLMKEDAVSLPSQSAANAATVLREQPQIANVSFADQQGNYILVRRGKDGGTESKVVTRTGADRRTTWVYRDAAGAEIGTREDPKDDFDPRSRPWYQGAIASDGLFWTGAYVFFTDRKPGITVAERYTGADGRQVVYGADITLDALSHFLAALPIGAHGRAVIIDSGGSLVAAGQGTVLRIQGAGPPMTAKIDEFGDNALVRAYDEYRTAGPGRHRVDIGSESYIVAATPMATAGHQWAILEAVPEADFVGFVTRSNRRSLFMSVAVVLAAAILAGLLVRQGLRADRAARLLSQRQRAIHRQSEGFARIAGEAALFDPAQQAPPTSLTETISETTGGRRATIWRLASGGRSLVCEDCFDRDSGHTSGLELQRSEVGRFLVSLEQGEELLLTDAARDRRTAEFHRVFMDTLGAHRLLAMPVRREKQTVGAITVEDPPPGSAGVGQGADFVRALANMLSVRMVRASRQAHTPESNSGKQGAAPDLPVRSFTSDLKAHGIDAGAISPKLYPTACILILQVLDPAAMALKPAAPSEAAGDSISDEIVRKAQQVGAENGIPYLKLLGHDLVAAAGLAETAEEGAARIAAAALALRDSCAALFDEIDRPPAFRIGVDCGLAIGSPLGAEPKVFNLWGDAVRTAHIMASSAPTGSVQASEAAYLCLRRDFQLRPRGRFYLPHVGEARTFILASAV